MAPNFCTKMCFTMRIGSMVLKQTLGFGFCFFVFVFLNDCQVHHVLNQLYSGLSQLSK